MKKRQEDEEQNRELEEKKKRERGEFMKKQKQKLEEEFKNTKQVREELAAKQQELSQKEKEYQLRIKQNMETFIKESQQDRIKEHEERLQINEFIKQQDVENIFALYEKSLRHMFKFYASQDRKDLDFNMERVMNTINFREFIRFSYQQNIVPVLLQPEDAVQVFRQLIRDIIEEQSNGQSIENYLNDRNYAQVLDYESFKKSLVRLAIMAQDSLGGQKEDLLLDKLDLETKKRQEEQRKKDKQKKTQGEKQRLEQEALQEMKEEFKTQLQKTQKQSTQGNAEIQYEINQVAKANEDAFFEKWMKQREAQGISLKKRIIGKEKEGSKKTIKKKVINGQGKDGLDDLRDGEDIEEIQDSQQNKQLAHGSAIVRKTKALKALKELEQQEAIKDQFAATKIENKKIRKDLNVMVVSAKTIEAFLKFLGIEPEDTRQGLDNKLNQARIEIQGQKPNKFKKQLKPNKIETIRQGQGNLALNQLVEEEGQEIDPTNDQQDGENQ